MDFDLATAYFFVLLDIEYFALYKYFMINIQFGEFMTKDVPQTNWADFLMNFASENEGSKVRLLILQNGEKKLLKEGHLISFEGDCSGEMVNAIKTVIGEEGAEPDNLFHNIESPKEVSILENDKTGEVQEIHFVDQAGTKSILEII